MDAIAKRGGNKPDLWNSSDVQVECDILTLDNSLDNEYASHLLSGTSLPINFAAWGHANQSTGNDKILSANIHRALSRLKSVFITLTRLKAFNTKTLIIDFIQLLPNSTMHTMLLMNTVFRFKLAQNRARISYDIGDGSTIPTPKNSW